MFQAHKIFLLAFLFLTIQAEESTNFLSFVKNHVQLRADGKIAIPAGIKHIKLDIGLSYNAPMSQYWLSHEDNLMVFGFEPNPASVLSIFKGATKRHPAHGTPLEQKYIGNSFFLIPCALGLAKNNTIKFFVTKEDCGCSSIYLPKCFEVNQIIDVPIFSLSDFFDIFPFDTHPIIDYIKIDAQGSDLNIAKSSGSYLAEHVVFITLEAENEQYENANNSFQAIDYYMKSIGFYRYFCMQTNDPTYLNSRFADYVKNHHIEIYQKG